MELMDNIYLESNWGLTEGGEEHVKKNISVQKERYKKLYMGDVDGGGFSIFFLKICRLP